LKGNKGFVAAY